MYNFVMCIVKTYPLKHIEFELHYTTITIHCKTNDAIVSHNKRSRHLSVVNVIYMYCIGRKYSTSSHSISKSANIRFL